MTSITIVAHTHTPVWSLVHSVPCLQYKVCVLEAMNVAEAWQQGYGLVHFTAFSTIGLALTKHGQSKNLVLRQLTLGVGPSMRKVEPFKHLLCETAHHQFLVVEL